MCDNAISRFVTLDPTARWVREGHDALFYKGGGKDKNDCDSYRPVTCLLHFYKWFAVLVLKQLVEECSWFLLELLAGWRAKVHPQVHPHAFLVKQ
jgi:hypothetical protein